MKLIIPGGNARILAKAIHMLAKIGDDIYLHPREDSISFRTANMAKSAYTEIIFYSQFFSYYGFEDFGEEDMQKCKIPMRNVMTIFKSVQILENHVENLQIILEEDACYLKLMITYQNDIIKTFLSPILDFEKLEVSYDKTSMINEVVSRARTFLDALQNFQPNLIEITLDATSQKLLLRNYVDDVSIMPNTISTQLVLSAGEFDRYLVSNDTTITFCMKEFKAILLFSEAVGVPITINFETAGKPILCTLKNQVFDASLLLATLSPDCNESDISMIGKHIASRSTRKKPSSSKNSRKRSNISCSRQINKRTTSIQTTANNIFNTSETECTPNKTLDQFCTATTSANAQDNNSNNDNKKKSQSKLQQNRFCIQNPANTLSVADTVTTNDQKKLVSSVFSSIMKRKSIDDEERLSNCNKEFTERDHEENMRLQSAKRVKIIFQKCFQETFCSEMLPGHDVIRAKDSDDSD